MVMCLNELEDSDFEVVDAFIGPILCTDTSKSCTPVQVLSVPNA